MHNGKPIMLESGSRQESILAEYENMAEGYDSGSEECGWNAPNILAQTLYDMKIVAPDIKVVDFYIFAGSRRRTTIKT